jgi:hypothetical protein
MENKIETTYYVDKNKKIVDLILGFFMYWGIGIVGGVLSYAVTMIIGVFLSSSTAASSPSGASPILVVLTMFMVYAPSCLVIVVEIALLIIFIKKNRKFISIGMVSGFVFSTVLTLLLFGACVLLLSGSSMSQGL